MKFRITEEIWKEGSMYVSYCPEMDISSCGHDIQEAKKNLSEAIQIVIEETQKMGTFDEFLEECGLEKGGDDMYEVSKKLVEFAPIEIAF